MFKKIKNIIKEFLKIEEDNLILWLPIFLAISITFGFNFNIKLPYILFINFFIFTLLFFFKNKFKYKYLWHIVFIMIIGFDRALISKNFNKTNTIDNFVGTAKIHGIIENEKNILTNNGDYRKEIIVKVNKIFVDNVEYSKPPQKIIVRLKNYDDKKIFLSKSIIQAELSPLRKQKFFSNFNTKRYYFFKNIGGIGYSGEILENSAEENLSLRQKIDKFRYKFADRIIKSNNSKASTIIATLLTGQKNLADKEAVESMNYSGLSHLLAISGLHMMTLISFIFFLTKWLLLRSEKIAIKYNVVKISACVSLLFNFFYLLLSGFAISAVRAYIMSSILLLSYLINRFNDSQRSIMFVMFLMLLFMPQSIFSIGFQLSFISVLSISAVANYWAEYKNERRKTFLSSKYQKILDYFILSFLISLTAEMATTPLTIYNFNNYTFYNVFTNLVAGPIVSLIILPFSIVAIILYFVKLEYLFVIPACFFMNIVLKMSDYILAIPDSIMFIKSPNGISMFFMIFGIFWFSLFKSKFRHFGYLFYLCGLIFLCFQKLPDVAIDKEDKSIFLRDINKNIKVYNPKKYSVNSIITKLENNEYIDITNEFKNQKYIYYNKNLSKLKIDLKKLNYYSTDIKKVKQENDLVLIFLK